MFDIKCETKKLIEGCIIKSHSGVNMYTPDGKATYAALWTRDFAYMIEYASDLLPLNDIRSGIQYLIDSADENGWIPDRVEKNGVARYTAGFDFPALPNLDNGCFLIMAADGYLKLIDEREAKEVFLEWKEALCRGIDCLPKDENGFIINDTQPPHSTYGFTDTVYKTGLLAYETLLLWKAQKLLCDWLLKVGLSADKYLESINLIEKQFLNSFVMENGMLKAATEICNQTDVWASCFAVSIGFPMPDEAKKRIAEWLIENFDSVVESGQIRHMPYGEFWDRTIIPIEKGTYQNGAFWATATGWFYDAIVDYNRELAQKLVNDVLKYFETYGIFECVNGEYRKLDTYVVSATNIYGLCKKYNLI